MDCKIVEAPSMPAVLREFLARLSFAEAGVIAEWVDETPDADVQMAAVIASRLHGCVIETPVAVASAGR